MTLELLYFSAPALSNNLLVMITATCVAFGLAYLHIPHRPVPAKFLEDLEKGRIHISDRHVREALEEVANYEKLSPEEKRREDRKLRKMERDWD